MKHRQARDCALGQGGKGSPSTDAEEQGLSTESKWAIAALGLPTFSYLLVYSINVGQAGHFGIPESLISVGAGDVLRVGLLAGVAGALVLNALRITVLGSPSHPGLREYAAPVFLLLALAALAWWTQGTFTVFWLFVGLAVLTGAVAWFRIARGKRKHGSISAVLDVAANRRPVDLPPWSPRAWSLTLERALQLRPLALVTVVLALLYLSNIGGSAVGAGMAHRQEEFLILTGRPDAVVLMVNDGNAIIGTLEGRGTIGSSFRISPLTELGSVESTTVGPLDRVPE